MGLFGANLNLNSFRMATIATVDLWGEALPWWKGTFSVLKTVSNQLLGPSNSLTLLDAVYQKHSLCIPGEREGGGGIILPANWFVFLQNRKIRSWLFFHLHQCADDELQDKSFFESSSKEAKLCLNMLCQMSFLSGFGAQLALCLLELVVNARCDIPNSVVVFRWVIPA